MAYTEDTRPEDLDALTAPAATDIVPIVDDPAGTPLTKKITLANLLKVVNELAAEIYPNVADALLLYDASVGTADKLNLDKLFNVIGSLSAVSFPLPADEVALFDASSGQTGNLTITNLFEVVDGLADIAAVPALTDTLLVVDNGTAKYVTKRNLQVRYVEVRLVAFDVDCATGDKQGGWHFHIPPDLNGLDLVYAHAEVDTAGTTNTMDLEIYNITQTQDMLSTTMTIDTGETGSDTAATPYVIHATQKDVATNDLIRWDCDAVHTTEAKGLVCTLGFG